MALSSLFRHVSLYRLTSRPSSTISCAQLQYTRLGELRTARIPTKYKSASRRLRNEDADLAKVLLEAATEMTTIGAALVRTLEKKAEPDNGDVELFTINKKATSSGNQPASLQSDNAAMVDASYMSPASKKTTCTSPGSSSSKSNLPMFKQKAEHMKPSKGTKVKVAHSPPSTHELPMHSKPNKAAKLSHPGFRPSQIEPVGSPPAPDQVQKKKKKKGGKASSLPVRGAGRGAGGRGRGR